MSAELIARLYAGLSAHDGDAMAACYAPDAVFEDPAFGELRDGEVREMWRMLCAQTTDLTLELPEHDDSSAHWIATYTFRTGKHVVNDVRSTFAFGPDGLIARQRDVFDLRRWGGQAIGVTGTVLGYTPLLRVVVQRTARRGLAAWKEQQA